jgi:hypothetical protein
MGRMPQLVTKGKKDRRLGEPAGRSWEEIEGLEVSARVELIRALIPLGLAEVGRILDQEVEALAGPRHGRKEEGGGRYRHGSNPGSIRLGGQRHPVRVPRVRDAAGEVKLVTYAQLQGANGAVDEGLLQRVLLGISCRDYEAAAEAVPGAIGLSKSQVSRSSRRRVRRSCVPGAGPVGVRCGGPLPGRQDLRGRHDGHRPRGHDRGRQGLPGLRPDGNGEHGGDEGPGLDLSGCGRWGQGPQVGLPWPGSDVSGTENITSLPKTEQPVAPAVAARLRAAQLQGGAPRTEEDPGRARRAEPIRR